ncbi:conserved hypothetical protein [Gammaproteobacteria bacterium]
MAKPIVLQLGEETSSFALSRLDRAKLYGYKERQVIDAEGQSCSPAYLTSDGSALVPGGGLAMLYVDPHFATIERSDLKTVDAQGVELALHASTLGACQALDPVTPQQVLDHVIHTVYQLAPEQLGPQLAIALEAGQIFKAPFAYREDYQLQTLFLVKGENAFFALIGSPTGFSLVRREAILEENLTEEDELSEDLDFSMM